MTATPDNTQFAAELGLLLGRLNRKLRVRTASGLTPSQASIIATLAAAGPLHIGELARREAVTAPSASRAVDRLVELELLKRTADPDDARRHTVALTRRGRAAAASSDDAATRLLAQALRRRTVSESRTLQRALPVLQAIITDLTTPAVNAGVMNDDHPVARP
ncbi:MAG TPA: MarR family transcriptional regulator [Jatrophihabitantaceae bacterium]|jgi:DNA-binding MarR family transcriptional regulator